MAVREAVYGHGSRGGGYQRSAPRSAKPEKLDHLNGPLVLHDAVIEQHRSLTEDIHRALVELLTKRFLERRSPG